jgi:hypothetical protein
MIKKIKMNTIVNITGITLKLLNVNAENVTKKQKKKLWYLKNKEKIKEYDRKYRKEVFNKKRRERRKTDPEYKRRCYLIMKKSRQKPEFKLKRNIYLKNKLKTDFNYKLIHTIRVRVKDVLRGHSKSDSTINMLGCTINELWIHLEKQFKQGMTRQNHGKWHIDHIIPCSSFDLTKPEEQAKCFHYTNLQPLWASENLAKGSKISS